MDSFCGISRIYFVREIFLRILNISLKHLLTLEKIFINTFFISFEKVVESKVCQYYCRNTFELKVNFLIQNTSSSFQTSIRTFNRVSCFFQHTTKNCLCFLSSKMKSEGRLTQQLHSHFCFTWNYLFVYNRDFFMLHFSVFT